MAALSKDQAENLRSALGLGPEVSDSAIEELAGTKAGMAWLQKEGTKGGGGGIGSFISGGVSALENAKGTKNIEQLFKGIGGASAPKKADPKAKATSGGNEADALKQLAQWLTQNYTEQGALAMGQQGQQLAQQNAAVTGTVDQFLTGTPSGNAAVDAAQAAYAKAYSAGEGLNSAAYANMGAANAQYLQESPLYPIANLLTQGFGSTQYKEVPQSVVQGLPPSVQAALAQAGITESTSAGGSGTPITVPKGASSGGAQNLAQILGLTNLNNPANPNTGVGSTLTPGTASNPTT